MVAAADPDPDKAARNKAKRAKKKANKAAKAAKEAADRGGGV